MFENKSITSIWDGGSNVVGLFSRRYNFCLMSADLKKVESIELESMSSLTWKRRNRGFSIPRNTLCRMFESERELADDAMTSVQSSASFVSQKTWILTRSFKSWRNVLMLWCFKKHVGDARWRSEPKSLQCYAVSNTVQCLTWWDITIGFVLQALNFQWCSDT